MDITIKNAIIVLKKYLEKNNYDKFEHCIRVAHVSKFLAKKFGVNVEDAIIVALLHDIGKHLSRREMLQFCMQNNIEVYDFEIFENPTALHGKISACIFEKEFDTKKEPERATLISHAISYHVAGGEDKMTMLDKIIYVADNIEPAKNSSLLSKIESDEITDINDCIRLIINKKIHNSKRHNRTCNPFTDITLDNINNEDSNLERL